MSKQQIIQGDCRAVLPTLPAESVHCVVTSPPFYGLRSYDGGEKEIGRESSPSEYVQVMVEVFREVKRVLRKDGTVWLNLGDSYASPGKGGKWDEGRSRNSPKQTTPGFNYAQQSNRGANVGLGPKQLLMIPHRVALALQADGWIVRMDIVWHKPNAMPESVTDRPSQDKEYLFLLAKSERYYFDQDAVREPHSRDWWNETVNDTGRVVAERNDGGNRQGAGNPAGRNKRSVWTIPTIPYPESHFATFPEKLVEPCILAGCPEGGTVLDPFAGSGTVGRVAIRYSRNFVGIELNPAYLKLIDQRTDKVQMKLVI